MKNTFLKSLKDFGVEPYHSLWTFLSSTEMKGDLKRRRRHKRQNTSKSIERARRNKEKKIMHSRSRSHHIERSHTTEFLLRTSKSDWTVIRQPNQQLATPEVISVQSEQNFLSNAKITLLSSPNPTPTMINNAGMSSSQQTSLETETNNSSETLKSVI
jgi:hypothetical protein